MPNRLLSFALLGLCSLGVQAQTKTLTFDNVSPNQTIRLIDTSNVSISTTGNLTAKCFTAGGSTCADIGTGTGANPPTVSLTASGFSNSADGNNAYPPGTTFTLTPSVTNADVCVRLLAAGSPSDSSWSGTMVSPFSAQSLSVNSQTSTYGFQLRCYNSGGSATSATVTVNTSTGVVNPPPENCNGVNPPTGFNRSGMPTTWNHLFGDTFPRLNIAAAQVPHYTQGGLTFLGATRGTYAAVEFTTPATFWLDDNGFRWSTLQWDPSQIGASAPAASAPSNSILLTISRCPGDFRVAIANPSVPTEGANCQSVRQNTNGTWKTPTSTLIYNQDGVTSPSTGCGLAPSTRYYLNYINANVTDTITTGEHTCPNDLNTCGVQIKHQ